MANLAAMARLIPAWTSEGLMNKAPDKVENDQSDFPTATNLRRMTTSWGFSTMTASIRYSRFANSEQIMPKEM
jgi:hypothetical protein